MPRSILEEDELPPLLTPEETKAALLAMFRSDLDANSGESSLTNSRNSPAVRTYHRQVINTSFVELPINNFNKIMKMNSY